MRLLEATVPNDCDIAIHGDTHEGARAAYTKGIDRLLEYTLSDPNRFLIHMGDEAEARMVDHPYFDIDNITPGLTKPEAQMESVRARYQKVAQAGRLLAWIEGNHTRSLKRYGNLTRKLCKELGVENIYGGAVAKLKLTNNRSRQICKIYLYHPDRFTLSSNAKDEEQRRANMMARIKWFLQRKASDCLIMLVGHAHKLIVVPPARTLLITDDGKELHQEYLRGGEGDAKYIEPNRRWYGCTGCFLRTDILDIDTYSILAGYDPIELGYINLQIRDGRVKTVEEVPI